MNNDMVPRQNGGMTLSDDQDGVLGMARQASQSTQLQTMIAMVDKKISTARAFPRSVSLFKREATQLLQEDVETARSAKYKKPVGKDFVEGPSIRLAEIAALCWTNLEIKIGEPVVTDKNVVVICSAWDLQRNTTQEGIASTSIVGKYGRFSNSMIETVVVATAAKARRNAILNIIPRSYINDLLEVAAQVAEANKKPLDVRRKDAVSYFARTYKVTAEQICATLSINGVDDIGEAELDTLTGIMTAIKEGEPVDSIFSVRTESKADEAKRKIAEAAARKSGPKADKTEKAEATKPAPQGHIPGVGDPAND